MNVPIGLRRTTSTLPRSTILHDLASTEHLCMSALHTRAVRRSQSLMGAREDLLLAMMRQRAIFTASERDHLVALSVLLSDLRCKARQNASEITYARGRYSDDIRN